MVHGDFATLLADLIYDIGMNNGDDAAYYLRRGFRVLAIEANPVLVEQASCRFEREIAAGILSILNIGVSDRDGVFPFWICDTHPEWSSFDRAVASRNDADHHQIMIASRPFRSIIREFGSPYYLKVDIEGNDICCLRDLTASDPPRYVSFEKSKRAVESLTLLHNLGYTGFKLISQYHYLPLEYPPARETLSYASSQKLLHSRNLLLRVVRKAGAKRWLERPANQARSRHGWTFPPGSSGPFGEDLPGRWQRFDEILETFAKANSDLRAKQPSDFWNDQDFSFWADFHVKREA